MKITYGVKVTEIPKEKVIIEDTTYRYKIISEKYNIYIPESMTNTTMMGKLLESYKP